MSKIAIVVGNPQRDSYCEALGQAYLRGAESGGHEAKLFLLARMNFDAILREGYRREQPLEPDLVAARAGLAGQRSPGVRVSALVRRHAGDHEGLHRARAAARPAGDPGAASGKANWKIFKGKSARIIMTMGMPGWFYRWYYGAHALKLLKRNILHFTGVSPVRSTIYGMIDGGRATTSASNGCARSRRSGHQARLI